MTTIGFPFEDLRPQVVKPKKSFFQRLNETHEQLVSHMRSLKLEEPSTKHPAERSRTPSTIDSQSTVTPSTTSSESERDFGLPRLSYSEIDYEAQPSLGGISPPLSPRDGSFTTSIQQFLTPRDRKSSRDFAQGMQSYTQWKQASHESIRPFHISPPQTPQSSFSWSSSISTSTQMTDEQIDDWLERPMDAELHRYRKLSEVSASWLDDCTETEEDQKKIHVIEEKPDEEDNAALENRQRASSLYSQDWNRAEQTYAKGSVSNAEDVVAKPETTKDADSKLLALPDELLQTIAFHVEPDNARPFRMSCMKLHDLVPAPLFTP